MMVFQDRLEKGITICLKNKKHRSNSEQKDKKMSSSSKKKGTSNPESKSSSSAKKHSSDSQIENDNFDNCAKMTEEFSYIEKDYKTLKKLLSLTREERKVDSAFLSANEILKKYPALNDKDLVIIFDHT